MRVFVTGATGFMGSAIVQELLHSGHQVLGLTRSDAGAQSLIEPGPRCTEAISKTWRAYAAEQRGSDAVIHTAFIHDFSQFGRTVRSTVESSRLSAYALAGSTDS